MTDQTLSLRAGTSQSAGCPAPRRGTRYSRYRMATITQLFRDTAFDPDTIEALCEAFEKARKSLHDTGQPYIVNEIIAKRIIALAEQGERDPDRLCEESLVALGIKDL